MSYIRAFENPNWEEGIGTGYYVYSSADKRINYLPHEHRPFIEVVMRMLDQSNELGDDELTKAHKALRSRLGVEEGSVGKNNTKQPAYEVGKNE